MKSSRPPLTEQQSDDTIELRKLAAEAGETEWEEEEATRPGMPSHSEITVNINNPLPAPPSVQTEEKRDSLPVPARIGLAFLRAVDSWPKVVGLALIIAGAYFLAERFTH